MAPKVYLWTQEESGNNVVKLYSENDNICGILMTLSQQSTSNALRNNISSHWKLVSHGGKVLLYSDKNHPLSKGNEHDLLKLDTGINITSIDQIVDSNIQHLDGQNQGDFFTENPYVAINNEGKSSDGPTIFKIDYGAKTGTYRLEGTSNLIGETVTIYKRNILTTGKIRLGETSVTDSGIFSIDVSVTKGLNYLTAEIGTFVSGTFYLDVMESKKYYDDKTEDEIVNDCTEDDDETDTEKITITLESLTNWLTSFFNNLFQTVVQLQQQQRKEKRRQRRKLIRTSLRKFRKNRRKGSSGVWTSKKMYVKKNELPIVDTGTRNKSFWKGTRIRVLNCSKALKNETHHEDEVIELENQIDFSEVKDDESYYAYLEDVDDSIQVTTRTSGKYIQVTKKGNDRYHVEHFDGNNNIYEEQQEEEGTEGYFDGIDYTVGSLLFQKSDVVEQENIMYFWNSGSALKFKSTVEVTALMLELNSTIDPSNVSLSSPWNYEIYGTKLLMYSNVENPLTADTTYTLLTGNHQFNILEQAVTGTTDLNVGNIQVKTEIPPGEDNTAPVITITGEATVTVEVGATYTDAGATASDTVDGNVDVITSGTVDVDKLGPYTITYTATDSSGNEATATRVVTVVDTTAPVITISGEATVTHEAATTYIDAGATASDLGKEVAVNTSGTVDENTVGEYTITYTATDGTNTATATRTVTVQDTTIPVITLLGDAKVTHEAGANYSDAGATASDTLDGNISSKIQVSSNVDTSKPGSYTVTYNVSDAAGNAASAVTRVVTVVDRTAPVITIAGDATVEVEVATTYIDAGATASDNVDGNVTGNIQVSSTVDISKVGSYTVTYNVSDAAGNAASAVTRTVNVVDTTAPVITITGESNIYIELGDDYNDKGATATDLGQDVAVNTSGTVNVNTLGTYTITYTATDSSNNKATATRTVYVIAKAKEGCLEVGFTGPQRLVKTNNSFDLTFRKVPADYKLHISYETESDNQSIQVESEKISVNISGISQNTVFSGYYQHKTDTADKSSTQYWSVLVEPPPCPEPISTPTLTLSVGSSQVGYNQEFTLTGTMNLGETITLYKDNLDSGFSPTVSTDTSFTFNASGMENDATYFAVATKTGHPDSSPAILYVDVESPQPISKPTLTLSVGSSQVGYNQEFTLTGTMNLGETITLYKDNLETNSIIQTSTDTSFTFNVPGMANDATYFAVATKTGYPDSSPAILNVVVESPPNPAIFTVPTEKQTLSANVTLSYTLSAADTESVITLYSDSDIRDSNKITPISHTSGEFTVGPITQDTTYYAIVSKNGQQSPVSNITVCIVDILSPPTLTGPTSHVNKETAFNLTGTISEVGQTVTINDNNNVMIYQKTLTTETSFTHPISAGITDDTSYYAIVSKAGFPDSKPAYWNVSTFKPPPNPPVFDSLTEQLHSTTFSLNYNLNVEDKGSTVKLYSDSDLLNLLQTKESSDQLGTFVIQNGITQNTTYYATVMRSNDEISLATHITVPMVSQLSSPVWTGPVNYVKKNTAFSLEGTCEEGQTITLYHTDTTDINKITDIVVNSGTIFSHPITGISSNTVYFAVAKKNGYQDSAVSSWYVTVADPPITQVEFNLSKGWNMIGAAFTGYLDDTESILHSTPELKTLTDNGGYQKHSETHTDGNIKLHANTGYFIRTSKSGKITLHKID